MNAFNADEVYRVLEMARQRGWIQPEGQCGRHVLYLTGQPRESGLAAANEHGMTAICVGHRAAEEWGIRYMASRFKEAFPGMRVEEVFEETSAKKDA